MVTIDDLAAAVRARLAGSPEVAAAIPGRGWFGRADEQATAPYAVFTLEKAGDPAVDSGLAYTQPWTLKVAVYTDSGAAGHDPQAAQLALARALPPTGWAALRDGQVLHCVARGFGGKFETRLRGGRDVFAGGGEWTLLVGGSLSA